MGIYLLMLLINLVNAAVPQFMRWMIDEGIYGGNLPLLSWAVLGLLGLTAVKGIFIYFQGIWTEISSQGVAYDLRNAVMHKLTSLSFAFHDNTEAGQILSRSLQDVERIRFLTGRAVLRLVEGGVQLLLTAVILLTMNRNLALLIILTLPLLMHRAYQFGKQFRPLSFQIQDQLGTLTTRLEQSLRGITVVKAFAQEEKEIDRFTADNEKWFQLSAKSVRIEAINAPLLDMMANFGSVAILWYGGWLVIQNQLTLGELVAFTTYLAQLIRPINLMGRIIPILAIAASAGERIFQILDTPSAVADAPDAHAVTASRGLVRFENVSFGYRDGQTILHDVNLEAQPGQVVALLGPTGSGKSTIINLLARFYEPTNGRITLDNSDTRDLTLDSLRQQIGIVMQDSTLFAASVRENIAFGRPEASEEEIIQAAKDAQAHEFISQMPEGYDTRVGERGVTLSGGQKQRLAIARALITDPRILILDDATASVDTNTEQLIQQALDRLMAGRTTFVIAHRLSTVRRADLILVMQNGRIATRGTHEELLQTSELYRQVYELQLRPQEVEKRLETGD
ncbi:MAG: ABC transporter ATP-binding protein [Ardenticatenaceae bacterium]|nr:ABC transporter ATP-binding protein [Ardenticatenaceae bacterium]